MNREDIILMAREAEHLVIEDYYTNGPVRAFSEAQLERFAALVVAAEREACAEIADRLPRIYRETQQAHYRLSPEPFKPERLFDLAELRQAEKITQAIRARGQA